MRLFNFTIIKLSLLLIIGITIGYLYTIPQYLTVLVLLALISLLFISFIIARKQFIKTLWFGLLAYLIMLCTGMLAVNVHNQKNFSNHYSNYVDSLNNSTEQVTFRVREVLKPGNYHNKYVLDILKVNNIPATGLAIKKWTINCEI